MKETKVAEEVIHIKGGDAPSALRLEFNCLEALEGFIEAAEQAMREVKTEEEREGSRQVLIPLQAKLSEWKVREKKV